MFESLNDPKFAQMGLYYDDYYKDSEETILDIYNGNHFKYNDCSDNPKIYAVLAEYYMITENNIEKAVKLYEKGIEFKRI